jgi:hypothetical protein
MQAAGCSTTCRLAWRTLIHEQACYTRRPCVQEDMEHLFSTVRDMTQTNGLSDEHAERVRQLVDSLRAPTGEWNSCKARLLRELDPTKGTGKHATRRGNGCCPQDSNSDVLQEELHTAKQLLDNRLKVKAWRQ